MRAKATRGAEDKQQRERAWVGKCKCSRDGRGRTASANEVGVRGWRCGGGGAGASLACHGLPGCRLCWRLQMTETRVQRGAVGGEVALLGPSWNSLSRNQWGKLIVWLPERGSTAASLRCGSSCFQACEQVFDLINAEVLHLHRFNVQLVHLRWQTLSQGRKRKRERKMEVDRQGRRIAVLRLKSARW
jgi:hypothetical protein